MAGARLIGQNERIAENAADRSGLDLAALGRRPVAAAMVPIIEQLLRGRVFHDAVCPSAAAFPRCWLSPTGTALGDAVTLGEGSARPVPAFVLRPKSRG